MIQLTGAVLVEIVGHDVVTWRILHDERHYLYSIDTPAVPAVLMADAAGPLQPMVVQADDRTIVQFKKRSPFYAMLYRRNGFVEVHEGHEFYSDNWRFDSRRLYTWLFPAHAVFRALDPPTLRPHAGQWRGQPLIHLVTPALQIEVEYQIDAAGFAAVGLPDRALPTLAELAAPLALPGGVAALEALRQAIAWQEASALLLEGTTWLGPLIRGTARALPADGGAR